MTLWPEDVSDPALGSLKVEGQQGLLGPWLEKDSPPPLLSDIPPGLIPE